MIRQMLCVIMGSSIARTVTLYTLLVLGSILSVVGLDESGFQILSNNVICLSFRQLQRFLTQV